MAQLWWVRPLPKPAEPHGTEPTDSFQQKAEPYLPWATREYQVIDGVEHLDSTPLTLNAPYPTTRSGFFKVSFFVKAKPGTDFDAFFDHWLSVHAANVRGVMEQVGGFRYLISHSLAPAEDPWAGLAELYFHDPSGWDAYRKTIRPRRHGALGSGRWRAYPAGAHRDGGHPLSRPAAWPDLNQKQPVHDQAAHHTPPCRAPWTAPR